MAFVADNSVIVGWFIPSQASDLTRKALRLSRRERVHVPALWQSKRGQTMSLAPLILIIP